MSKPTRPAPADCDHADTWFDRTLCPCVEGGTMHTVCADCDAILDNGGHEAWLGSLEDQPAILLRDTPEDRERLAAVLASAGLTPIIKDGYAIQLLDATDAILAELRTEP